MTAAKALYFPYIEVPQSPWFTQLLLYWDKVGAIVPYEYIQDPERLGPYMVGLVRENLVEQVIPGMYLWRSRNFEEAFLDYVDGLKFRAMYQPTWPKVHMEKLQGLGEKLCSRHWAVTVGRPDDYSRWYQLEPRVADLFMAYLASVLGQLTEEKFYPITEDSQRLTPFVAEPQGTVRTRKIVLNAILPTPTQELEAAQLADFKAAHNNELRLFRWHIEDKLSELSVIEHEQQQLRRAHELSQTLRKEVDELAHRMREEKGWPKIGFADFCAVAGVGVGVCQALLEHAPLGFASAALGLAPIVYNAFRGTNLHLEDKPLAYAASAQLAFA